MRRFFRRGDDGPRADPGLDELRLEARRGRELVEESREIVVVLDERRRVVAASRRARELIPGLERGRAGARLRSWQNAPLSIPYEVDGRRETLLYARDSGDMAAYEELRAGFTAAVSHELRTPLARLLALLETASCPGPTSHELIEQAQGEVAQIRELIDDILFLSELESGHEVVGLGSTQAFPIVVEVAEALAEQAARAGVTVVVDADEDVELPVRPRMIRVHRRRTWPELDPLRRPGRPADALRSGTRTTASRSSPRTTASACAEATCPASSSASTAPTGRAPRAGTGLGLAIVKHVVTSAGGTVEATGARGRGLTIRCVFPGSSAAVRAGRFTTSSPLVHSLSAHSRRGSGDTRRDATTRKENRGNSPIPRLVLLLLALAVLALGAAGCGRDDDEGDGDAARRHGERRRDHDRGSRGALRHDRRSTARARSAR